MELAKEYTVLREVFGLLNIDHSVALNLYYYSFRIKDKRKTDTFPKSYEFSRVWYYSITPGSHFIITF